MYFIAFNIAAAQPINHDSLLGVWNDPTIADTARLKALVLSLSGRDLNTLAAQRANDLLDRGLEQARRLRDGETILELLLVKGRFHRERSEYLLSLQTLREGLGKARDLQDGPHELRFLNGLASLHLDLSNYERANEFLLEALKLSEAVGDTISRPIIQGNIGLVHLNLEEYEEALAYHLDLLAHQERTGDTRGMMSTLNNIGLIYIDLEAYERAIVSYQRALALKNADDFPFQTGFLHGNLGEAYRLANDYPRALHHLQRSLSIHEQHDLEVGRATSLYYLAKYYDGTGSDSLFIAAQQSLTIGETLEDTDIISANAELLYRAYEKRARHDLALAYYRQYRTTQDSIMGATTRREILQRQIEYDFEKQTLSNRMQSERRMLEQRLAFQRTLFISILIFLLLLIGTVFYFRRRRRKSLLERRRLLKQVKDLKRRLANVSITEKGTRRETSLDKNRIEIAVGRSLSTSSWQILQAIFTDPSISNKQIAERVFLSVEGVSSALRRMYTLFEIKPHGKGNKKVALLSKAIELSLDGQSES